MATNKPRLSATENKARKAAARYYEDPSASKQPTGPANTTDPRLGALLRISASDDASMSIPSQLDGCIEAIRTRFPSARFDPDTDVFIDDSLSGGGNVVRDGLEAAMGRIKDGTLDGIVVVSWDRFLRSVRLTQRAVQDLRDARALLHVVNEPSLNIYDVMGDMRIRMLAEAAEAELNSIKERNQRGHRRRAAEGILRIAVRPLYGMKIISKPVTFRVAEGKFYAPDDQPFVLLAHNPDYSDSFDDLWTSPGTRADVVRWVADRVAEGHKRTALAQTLNGRGIPAPTEMGWSQINIRNLLTNRALIGNSVHKGEVLLDDEGRPRVVHTPLLTNDVFHACQDQLAPREFSPRGESTAWLVGLVRCGHCGRSMSVNGSTSGSYVCATKYRYRGAEHNCPGNTIGKRGLEAYLNEVMRGILRDEASYRAALAANRSTSVRRTDSEIAAEMDAARTKITTLHAMKADGDYDYPGGDLAYKNALQPLKSKLKRLASEREPVMDRTDLDLGRNPLQSWENAAPERRRLIATQLLGRIVIRSGGGRGARRGTKGRLFDHTRITVVSPRQLADGAAHAEGAEDAAA